MNRKLSWLGYGACALAGCLWGTGFYFGKLALREMSVGHMVLYRFLFASLGIIPLLWKLRHAGGLAKPAPWTRNEIVTLLAAAALGIPIQFLLQFAGLARTTVSHASLMVGTLPVLLALGATLDETDAQLVAQRLDGRFHLLLGAGTDDEDDLGRDLGLEQALERVQEQGPTAERGQQLVKAHALTAPGRDHHCAERFTHILPVGCRHRRFYRSSGRCH